ncbi:MAG: hypothetical protein AAF696_38665 [Bacteroidota bacterium]
MTLSAEFKWYRENQESLLSKYEGKVLAIKDLTIIGVYTSYGEAYIASAKMYMPGSFLLQKCSSGPADYTPKVKKLFKG